MLRLVMQLFEHIAYYTVINCAKYNDVGKILDNTLTLHQALDEENTDAISTFFQNMKLSQIL